MKAQKWVMPEPDERERQALDDVCALSARTRRTKSPDNRCVGGWGVRCTPTNDPVCVSRS